VQHKGCWVARRVVEWWLGVGARVGAGSVDQGGWGVFVRNQGFFCGCAAVEAFMHVRCGCVFLCADAVFQHAVPPNITADFHVRIEIQRVGFTVTRNCGPKSKLPFLD